MVIDGNFDAVVVASSAFAERAGAPQEHPTAVAQLAVERFDHLRARFVHDVGMGRQHLRVGSQGVSKVARVAAVAAGQRVSEPGERGRAPAAQHPGHDTARRALDSQPQPDLALSLVDKGPHLIQLEGLLTFVLRLSRPQARQQGHWQLRFFLPAWQSCYVLRPSGAQCCAVSYARAATGRPALTGAPFRGPQAGNSLGGSRLCTGIWPARHYCRCGEFAHWRNWRIHAACKPSPNVIPHPHLTHYYNLKKLVLNCKFFLA